MLQWLCMQSAHRNAGTTTGMSEPQHPLAAQLTDGKGFERIKHVNAGNDIVLQLCVFARLTQASSALGGFLRH